MGCHCSKQSKYQQNRSGPTQIILSPHQDIQPEVPRHESSTSHDRKQFIRAIFQDDLILLAPFIAKFDPTETLLSSSKFMNAFHMAAKYNSRRSMALLLEWIHTFQAVYFDQIIKIPDYQTRTCLTICIQYHSVDAFYEILKYAFQNNKTLPFESHDLIDHTNACLVLVKLYQDKNLFRDKKILIKTLNTIHIEDIRLQEELQQHSARDKLPHTLEATYSFAGYNIKPNFLLNTSLRKTQDQNQTYTSFLDNKHYTTVHDERVSLVVNFFDMTPESKIQWNEFLEFPSGSVENHLTRHFHAVKEKQNEVLYTMDHDTKLFDITADLLEKNEVFIDPDFPHNLDSLGGYFERHITWSRPHEILGCGYNQINLFDQVQLLSPKLDENNSKLNFIVIAIATLSEYPSRVLDIFLNRKINPKGCYGLKTFVMGAPVEVYIDDAIPCEKINANGIPVPANFKVEGSEIWPYLIEKAWAKFFGDYSHKESGFSDEIWEYLLGAPTFVFNLAEIYVTDVWDILMSGTRERFYMMGITKPGIEDQQALDSSTCFTILAVYEISNVKIIKVKGVMPIKWKGSLSKTGPFWSHEMAIELGNSSSLPRTFYLTFEEFMQFFNGIMVAHYQRGWEHTHITCESHPKHPEYFEFKVDNSAEVYIRLHQRNKKITQQEYSPCEFDVFKKQKDGTYENMVTDLENIDRRAVFGHHTCYVSSKPKLILTEGEYLIRAKVKWNNNRINRFTISCYASTRLELQKTEKIPGLWGLYALHYGITSHNLYKIDHNCEIGVSWIRDLFYIYCRNQGSLTWTVKAMIKKMVNVKIVKRYRNKSDMMEFNLEPDHECIGVLRIINIQKPASFAPIFNYEWK